MSVSFLTKLIKADGVYFEGRKAAGYRIVIQCDKLDRKTSGGLEAYGSESEYMRNMRGINTGVVVSVGSDAYKGDHLKSEWVKVGDRVRYGTYSGDLYEENDRFYRIINDEDIYEVLENEYT